MRKHSAIYALCAVIAAPALAGFTAEATTRPGIETVKKVAIVTPTCVEVFNCVDVEKRLFSALPGLHLAFTALDPAASRGKLLDFGVEEYTTDLRQRLADSLGVDALLELELVHGEEKRLGVHGSTATVKLRLVRPTGEILLLGNGTGRPVNTVSSPERIAAEVFENILKKAFEKPPQ